MAKMRYGDGEKRGVGGNQPALTRNQNLPLLLSAVSSLRLIRGWWQAAATLPGTLWGVMMGASGQGPQEEGLLVVIPCYLCRGQRGQLHPHTPSCSLLDSLFALGRKKGSGKQTAGRVCPGEHRTPSISQLRSLSLSLHTC